VGFSPTGYISNSLVDGTASAIEPRMVGSARDNIHTGTVDHADIDTDSLSDVGDPDRIEYRCSRRHFRKGTWPSWPAFGIDEGPALSGPMAPHLLRGDCLR
jgi:hypothetical protein